MNWLKFGNRVQWFEDGVEVEGIIIGQNRLFGERGRSKGFMVVDVEIVEGGSWEFRFQKGFVRMVKLVKGKFNVNGQKVV